MTSPHTLHLTDEELESMANDTIAPARREELAQHLAQCDACANDVARLSRLMTHFRESSSPPVSPSSLRAVDEMWPGIRSQIEQRKVVQLSADATAPSRGNPRRVWYSLAAAAAVVIVAGTVVVQRRTPSPSVDTAAVSGPSIQAVADSTRAYEHEAQVLVNRLELMRAMMPPETRASIDRNLRVVDLAIAELRDAIARDPNNPALRRLLASSYRQKVDLLKRIGNAG